MVRVELTVIVIICDLICLGEELSATVTVRL